MSGRYRILVNSAAVYVKEEEFWESQGGRTEPWGKDWELVYADGIEHARLIGKVFQTQRGLKSTVSHFPY